MARQSATRSVRRVKRFNRYVDHSHSLYFLSARLGGRALFSIHHRLHVHTETHTSLERCLLHGCAAGCGTEILYTPAVMLLRENAQWQCPHVVCSIVSSRAYLQIEGAGVGR